jgi:hypothetical protein
MLEIINNFQIIYNLREDIFTCMCDYRHDPQLQARNPLKTKCVENNI